MDDPTLQAASPAAELPPPAPPPSSQPETRYVGNNFDLYAMIAGIVGITSLALCFTGNMIVYCLPLVPLVFGIIALRNSGRSLDPSRTRTMGWIGVAAGIVGIVVVALFALLMTAYLAFIFTMMNNFIQTMPRRP